MVKKSVLFFAVSLVSALPAMAQETGTAAAGAPSGVRWGVIGAAIMITYSLYTSLTQLIVPNELRGRVMSVYMLAFRGGMPGWELYPGDSLGNSGENSIGWDTNVW